MRETSGGWLTNCECGWEAWHQSHAKVADQESAHVSKCDGRPKERAVKTTARGSSARTWNDREGSTWIDKL